MKAIGQRTGVTTSGTAYPAIPSWLWSYDALGQVITAKSTVANALANTGNLFTYRFSTKPKDIETGFCYYGYRYYDPMTGRWQSRDPIEENGGFNLYGFIGNNGVDKWDILGNECCCVYICTKADLFTNPTACRRESGKAEDCAQNIILSPAPSIISPLRLAWSFKSCKDGETHVQVILQDNWSPVTPNPNLA